jgi:hypothetical protein
MPKNVLEKCRAETTPPVRRMDDQVLDVPLLPVQSGRRE